jgi:hypothetical protein
VSGVSFLCCAELWVINNWVLENAKSEVDSAVSDQLVF